MTRLRLAALLALAAVGSCGDDEPLGPQAGDLTLSYTSTGQSDGALLLLVTGGPVESVAGVGSNEVASAAAGTNTIRVVVTGTLSSGDVVKIRVADVSRVSDYNAHVEAVADRNTFALIDPSGYAALIRK